MAVAASTGDVVMAAFTVYSILCASSGAVLLQLVSVLCDERICLYLCR